MLLHLPIVILTTLWPVAVSDTVPAFDIVKECRYEGGSTADIDRCSKDETAALEQLKSEWARFVGPDKSSCMTEATTLDFRSYVELQVCLEMASEVRKDNTPDPSVGTEPPSLQFAQPGIAAPPRLQRDISSR
jgi:hypothetical protein